MLATEGFTIVESFLDSETVEALLALVRAYNAKQTRLELRGRPSRELGEQVHNLHAKDSRFLDLVFTAHKHPLVAKILKDNLQDPFYNHLPPDVPNYILSGLNARSSGTALKLHMDTYIPSSAPTTWMIQLAFCLDDSTLENGCTLVVPRSHRSGTFVDYAKAKPVPVVTKAGALVMWDSRIWHGTSANVSGKSRWSIIAVFSCWWVKPKADITRSVPNEYYQQLDERQKVLLGFCSIPPKDESERINFKGGFEDLRPSVSDYYQ